MQEQFSKQLVEWLKQNNKTIVTAESLTGGMVAARICDYAGVSAVFLEGIVAYSEQSKHHRLGVSLASLEQFSPVSEQVCREMAEGAQKFLGADYAIATTGVAGPDEYDDRGNPRGLFFIGVASKDETKIFRFQTDGTRDKIRIFAMKKAFEKAVEVIVG